MVISNLSSTLIGKLCSFENFLNEEINSSLFGNSSLKNFAALSKLYFFEFLSSSKKTKRSNIFELIIFLIHNSFSSTSLEIYMSGVIPPPP